MFGSRVLGAIGVVCLSAMGAQAATVNASITGPDRFNVGEFFAIVADIAVTPNNAPVYDTGPGGSGIPQLLNWDFINLNVNFDGGNGYTESIAITDTSPALPNNATDDPFDLLPVSFFPDFVPDYTAPGVYTQTLTGTVSFVEEQLVTFTERRCTATLGGFGGGICISYETVFRTELRDVIVDSGTFSVSRDISVIAPVPLPASALLLLAGLGSLAARRRLG